MISSIYIWHAARINYFQTKRSNPEPKQRRTDMNELLMALVLNYTIKDNLDLDLICKDIKTKKLSPDDAQNMLDAQNENGYEIQIEEICE